MDGKPIVFDDWENVLSADFKRDPGDFSDFTRSRRGRMAPIVLTQAECKRLFDAMSGTSCQRRGDSRCAGYSWTRGYFHHTDLSSYRKANRGWHTKSI